MTIEPASTLTFYRIWVPWNPVEPCCRRDSPCYPSGTLGSTPRTRNSRPTESFRCGTIPLRALGCRRSAEVHCRTHFSPLDRFCPWLLILRWCRPSWPRRWNRIPSSPDPSWIGSKNSSSWNLFWQRWKTGHRKLANPWDLDSRNRCWRYWLGHGYRWCCVCRPFLPSASTSCRGCSSSLLEMPERLPWCDLCMPTSSLPTSSHTAPPNH